MSKEIVVEKTSGLTIYVVLSNANCDRWNTTTQTFENHSDANWTFYDIALTEQGLSGTYIGDWPAVITAPGQYRITAYQRDTGTPLINDTKIASGNFQWSGTAEITSQTNTNLLLAVKSKTDNLPTDPADASDVAAGFAAVETALTTGVNIAPTGFDNVVYGGMPFETVITNIFAATAGKNSGVGTAVEAYYGPDAALAFTSHLDTSNNRSLVEYEP